MSGLNLSSEFGEYDSPVQGVKVQLLNSRNRLGNLAHATAVVSPPTPRERSADVKAGMLSFPYPYVEALGARWAHAVQVSRAVASPLGCYRAWE